ncbi:double-strand break repair helicase AddA [Sphingosinicella sp. LHD-64]|uniref:double-strand break repair helicase AddA n=1 Tax=Sphingosinicella sp. LHD-64 TaxID=3072139 RepID=UPI00280E1A88|nr:double-strand break repair helicase AddA [Sphingosinicella sp. LHD-64]MDQ8755135.1 double-strand break repair helicase AddA [Sphingosinicella sp. LHD-64]
MSRLRPLAVLEGDQLRASHPRDHAALSASAGTGKTHVLTARVLRLLLAGVDPASILCLTFTKAGAAEMAERIHARLAYWVRLKDAELGAELLALDEDPGPETRALARTLFARVLEATGGGLRIQTIHAFAQSLLAAFPTEAELVPGFRPLDGRDEQLLARTALADLLVRSEAEGDLGLIADMQALSLRLGEGGAESFLKACARAPDAMTTLGVRGGIEARLRHAFELPLGDIDEAIAAACADDMFDIAALRRIGALNGAWGTRSGLEREDMCARWLAAEPAQRVRLLADLHTVWAKADGELRSFGKGQAPPDPDYAALAEAAFDFSARLLSMRARAVMVASLAAGLRAGQAFALAYADAKRAAGAVDFDDLIRRAEKLLLTPGMGEWVRYKLDQRTDHILVDEAQDTNTRQWNIVRAIALEYFAGEGARGRHRTIFTVGDYKQAIFGFQGTDPESFDHARAWFAREAEAIERAFLDLSMDRSFRSAPQILEVVDRVIGDLGHDAFGLPRRPNPHESHHAGRTGSVTLWAPYSVEAEDNDGEEGWIAEGTRAYAGKLARQVRRWLDHPFHVQSRGRPLRPEDILILVRRRGDLAALLVARLHAEGVPVAGVDRLLLSAPLAVQDLLAAARFAVQPRDDLNLASLLVSPLFGWDQDRLHAVAAGRDGPLWPRLRGHGETPAETLQGLQAILAMADFATPHGFFEALLSGPFGGRRKLLERLGPEARDPIEELLSAALEFEGTGTSLQGFLDWFARGDVEIVRDPSGPRDAVRVMTVHGSKGLQSPVLILADACADPDRKGPGTAMAELELADGARIPVFRPRKDELAEPLASQVARREKLEREEHWRLLYVALTRAEERLYVGGALTSRDRNGAPETSWHRAVETALAGLGQDWTESDLWTREIRLGPAPQPQRAPAAPAESSVAVPGWLWSAAPVESRPPRPLAPSSIGEDDVSDPPPSPDQRAAALRGRLLHQLFERLPGVAPPLRPTLADQWLEHAAGIADPALRALLVADACRVIEDAAFAELFGPQALAEAPIAAVIAGGVVVAGTVDRLLVSETGVLVADFKTGRRAPLELDLIPPAHLRQMAAYRAALRVVFPDRPVRAALLYTAAPILHALPDDLLDAHGPSGA